MTNIFIWFADRIVQKKISIHAAQVAFFILVSFFPFFMFLFSVSRYTILDEGTILRIADLVMPGNVSPLISDWLKESYDAASGTILSLTVVFALWSGSKGFNGMILGLEEVYQVEKQRNYIWRRIHSIADTVVFTVMILFSILLLVYGNQIVILFRKTFPFLLNLELEVFLLRSVIALFLFLVYFLVLFRFVPGHSTTIKQEFPGALLSSFLWIAFSYLYSFYIDYHSSFSSLYGSLTYIVSIMIWMYFSIFIIFLGALLNQYLKEEKKLNLLRSIRQLPGQLLLLLDNNKK